MRYNLSVMYIESEIKSILVTCRLAKIHTYHLEISCDGIKLALFRFKLLAAEVLISTSLVILPIHSII